MLQSFDGYIYMYQHTKVWGFPFITIVSLKVIPPIVLFQPRSWFKNFNPYNSMCTYIPNIHKKEPEKKKCIWLLWPHMVELWSDSQSNNSNRSCNLKHFVLWLYKYKISFEKKNSKQSHQIVYFLKFFAKCNLVYYLIVYFCQKCKQTCKQSLITFATKQTLV